MEAESTPVATKPKLGSGRSKGLLLLGVVWPSATILFEWLTRACAAEFFDPLPTWIHLFLVLLVPVTAFCAWRRSGHDDLTIAVPHERVLLGAAWFVASVYILSFVLITIQSMYLIMLVPLALAAEAGMAALLPWMAASLPFMALGPLMAWLTLWFTQKRLVKGSTSSRLPWVGAAAAALALCLVEVPLLFTSKVAQFHRGAQPSVKWTYEKGIRWIGSEPILRQLAYGRLNTPPGLFCWMGGGGLYSFRNFSDLASTESASDLYYRSYGRLHTQLQPLPIAQSHLDFDERRGGSEDGINGFVWDSDVGGDRTGVRMKGLTMKSSRLDWHLDPVSSLAYGEWTIEFNNSYSNPQEARCQILLPPSGFVSRLTLWVNGEPREAAFATPSKVKAAYQTVAIQQRRDPVLVNITGPDRIMAQCFPVPAGGMIKIRLGITAPIPEEGLVMPALIERNFTIPEGTRHHTWLQSPQLFECNDKTATFKDGQNIVWRQEVAESAIGKLRFKMATPTTPSSTVWCEDPHGSGEDRFISAHREESLSAKPQSAIIVVDGSLPMREWIDEIQQALEELGKAMPIEVILARSSSFEGVPKERLQSLSQRDFVGGSDNAPALMHALDLARTMPGKVALLWLHGPQPFEFADTAGLAQLFQRSASAPALQTISLVPGPNRLIEKLYSQTSIQTHGRCMDAQDLRAILRRSLQLDPVSHWSYVRSATAPLDAAAIKVWDHLARMAVFEKVMAGCRIENEFAALGAIAVKHQIVTPVSGAVVLETQQQYDKAGLQPGDPNASPQIPLGTPEPSRVVLLLIGLTLLLLQRRRV